MPRVSRSRLTDERLSEITDHFSYLVSSLSRDTEIKNFLEQFLTKEEKVMLAKRLVLFMMLRRNYSPPTIESALHVSYETVRSYQNLLLSKDESFFKIIDKLLRREKTVQFFKKLDKIFKPLELIMKSRNDMRARAKFASGNWSDDEY